MSSKVAKFGSCPSHSIARRCGELGLDKDTTDEGENFTSSESIESGAGTTTGSTGDAVGEGTAGSLVPFKGAGGRVGKDVLVVAGGVAGEIGTGDLVGLSVNS